MKILNDDCISGLLSFGAIVDAVEQAMIAFEKKATTAPKRMHVEWGENTLLLMPSFEEKYFGTKLVSVVPDNKDKNLPVTNGVMLLNDAVTGLPLALLNAAKLTALRTGALGAIGVKYITPGNIESIGIIGSGVQGIHQALLIPEVRNIEIIFCLHRSDTVFENFKKVVTDYYPSIKVEACYSTEEILASTNVVVAATTSSAPVLPDEEFILKGKHFISIGSYKPSMQEFPDAVYQLAGELAVDSDYAKEETGDVINALNKKLITEENVYPVAKLITGERKTDVNKTTVYKSSGMAIFDLFVAKEMYKAAIEKNIGVEVAL